MDIIGFTNIYIQILYIYIIFQICKFILTIIISTLEYFHYIYIYIYKNLTYILIPVHRNSLLLEPNSIFFKIFITSDIVILDNNFL